MGNHEPVTQKMIRCRRFVAETQVVNPRYKSNTPKEELLLEHVREFEEQFVLVYGNRFLFLCPPNEFGIPKFVSTTIRPTHLAFKELYEYRTCAQFLADFLNYEELNPPNKYPSVIPAPASVLKWQAGDCFDMSITLCSLLLGVGYDAYCVSGFAPRFITTRNEARSTCPLLEEDFTAKDDQGHEEEDDQKWDFIPKKAKLKSEYLEKLQAEKEETERKAKEDEMKSDSDDDPSSDEDEYENQRIHCWVLVRKGSRDVAEDMYIEPTTGRIYSLAKCPYLKIDLIWNHRNLWVNMQICEACNVELDLYNSQYFEYVMLDPEAARDASGGAAYAEEDAAQEAAGDGEAKKSEQVTQLLDMPPPWSERLDISREAFHARCYQGEKTIFYHKCKVEQYAPYSQVDGLVQRITLHKDVRRQIPIEVRETFQHRHDHLVERERFPMENRLVEKFEPGRGMDNRTGPHALKEFREVAAVRREMIFYNSRLDGLVQSVEDIGKKFCEFFEDRDDRLIYHSVTLDQSLANNTKEAKKLQTLSVDSMGDIPVRKMTQKYARNPEIPLDQDYHKIVFLLAEGKIRVDYHREPGKITYHSITFWKDDNDNNKLRYETRSPEDSHRKGQPMPTAQQVTKLLQMEKNCRMTFMDSLNKNHSELTFRRKEENNIRAWRSTEKQEGQKTDYASPASRETPLEKSVYDLAREHAREDALREGNEEEKEEEQASKVDILAPYLVDFQGKQLDALQAEFVCKKCKNDFRKRLLDRAQIIQKRLEDEQDQLKKRRSQMQRRGDNVEKDERAFEQYQSNAMFRIQILEQRLARHELQAINKMTQLEKTLTEDPRLAAMWQKGPAPGEVRVNQGNK